MFENDQYYKVLTIDGEAAGVGSGVGNFSRYSYGFASASSIGGCGTMSIAVHVPFATSVVVCDLDDGTRLWQRPIAGYGLSEVPSQDDSLPPGTIVALDVDGNEIGRWDFH
jgi:hypothetical protein